MEAQPDMPEEHSFSNAELAEATVTLENLWKEYSLCLTTYLECKLDCKQRPSGLGHQPIQLDLTKSSSGEFRQALERLEQASRACFQFSNGCLEAGGKLAEAVRERVDNEIESANKALGFAEKNFRELSAALNQCHRKGAAADGNETELEILPVLLNSDICFQRLQALQKMPLHLKNGRIPLPRNILELLTL